MASWMIHLRIADKLLDRLANIEITEFIMGNIAPDSGVPNEDWSVFTPSGDISHFKEESLDGWKNINIDKKERLITGEANANNELINLNLQSFLAPRQEACKRFNDLFGLTGTDKEISVKLRSDLYNIIKQEESIVNDYNHNFNWFFVIQDPFYLLPKNIAPFIMPFVNVIIFFIADMLVYLVYFLIKRINLNLLNKS